VVVVVAVARGETFDVSTWSGSGQHPTVRASDGAVIWGG
jgi:hypothetical protein